MRKLHSRAVGFLVVGLVALSPSDPTAQERQIITMDAIQGPGPMLPGAQRNFKTGTGRIRGRILSAETGQPVRRVQVRIIGQDIAPKTMLTDADGRYEFAELPAGRFTVSATKSGFVNVQYGQTRPFESGKPIELVDAQLIDKADISLPRGSVIAGRIVDEFGEPVTDAMVSAMRSVWTGGRRRLQPAGRTGQTNDLGQYRIFGLPPGDYYVSASFRGGEMMMIEMAAAATIGGGSAASPTSGYASTYYPGTTSAPEAQRVRLALGQEVAGTDFALAPVKLARVSGTVMRSDGQPAAGTMVSLMPRTTENVLALMDRSGRTDPNGNFTVNGVSPGDYNLQVRGMSITTMTTAGGGQMVFTSRVSGPAGSGAQEAEFGSVPVTVAGEDVTNVVVTTTKGATAAGRLTFEGAAQPATLGGIRVTATSVDNEPTIVFPGGPGQAMPGSLQADGSFELRGLAGTRLVRVQGLPPGWVLKSVNIEGQDVTDTGFDFKPGAAIAGVDVVITNKTSEVNGSVTTSNGQPVKDFTLVLFAEDPAKWTFPQTRYVTAARPDQEGRVKVRNLPAGDYFAIAVEYLAQGEWGDPEVLDRLKGKATRITLNEGESKAVTLKIEKG
jgi:5-hydroxyisourate hydrolase-like protein (transthyretin family)